MISSGISSFRPRAPTITSSSSSSEISPPFTLREAKAVRLLASSRLANAEPGLGLGAQQLDRGSLCLGSCPRRSPCLRSRHKGVPAWRNQVGVRRPLSSSALLVSSSEAACCLHEGIPCLGALRSSSAGRGPWRCHCLHPRCSAAGRCLRLEVVMGPKCLRHRRRHLDIRFLFASFQHALPLL